MKRLLNYIGSRRFAIYLLLATLSVVLISNLLPNFSIMKQDEVESLRKGRPLLYAVATYLQIGSVVNSPLFLLLPAFLFTSVSICTLKRIKKEGGRERRPAPGETKYSAGFSGDSATLLEFLQKKGWAAELGSGEQGDVVIVGHKGRKGFWGSIVFHLGMNVVLIGTALSLATRFNGSMVLTEDYGARSKEAFLGAMPKGFPIKGAVMEGFMAVYKEGFPVDYSMNLTLWGDEMERKEEVKVNKPLSWRGYQFAPVRYGFSPKFILMKGDRILLDGYVNMVIITPEQIDSFEVPGEGMKVTVQFFPDFYKEGLTPMTRSREPKNPVFFVEASKGKEKLGRGFLHMGQDVPFAGYRLKLDDLKMWAMFDVSRDSGMPAVTLGFILIVSGLIIRLIWNERAVWAFVRDGMVEVGGKARYFPALFEEELKSLTEEMKTVDST